MFGAQAASRCLTFSSTYAVALRWPPGPRASLGGRVRLARQLCWLCVDLGPRERCLRHGTHSLPAFMSGFEAVSLAGLFACARTLRS
jgi:hypothetical protein